MRRSRRPNDRRGATLLLVALLMVPMIALAAFAIDASWWQVGANQLQTTADASALAGARALQLYRNESTVDATIKTYATNTAAANKAFSQTISLPADDIDPVFWDPTTKTATEVTGWALANGVQVTTRGTPNLMLAGVVRPSAPTVERRGVAWIANIQNGKCVKPWALPYTILYDSVVAATGLTSSIAPTAPSTNPPFRNNLSPAQIASLNDHATDNTNVAQRTIMLRGPNTETVNFPVGAVPASLPAMNQWYAYNFSGNASGPTTYQGEIGNCGPGSTEVEIAGGTGATVATGGGDVECWTIRALQKNNGNTCGNGSGVGAYSYLSAYGCTGGATNGCPLLQTCEFKPFGTAATDVNDAGCYPVGGTAGPVGVEVIVAWGDGTGNGANLTSIRQVGRFRVVCVFRTFIKGSSSVARTSAIPDSPTERCAVPNGQTYTNLPAGTIVGIIGSVGLPVIDADTQFGNTPALEQRLILVR